MPYSASPQCSLGLAGDDRALRTTGEQSQRLEGFRRGRQLQHLDGSQLSQFVAVGDRLAQAGQ